MQCATCQPDGTALAAPSVAAELARHIIAPSSVAAAVLDAGPTAVPGVGEAPRTGSKSGAGDLSRTGGHAVDPVHAAAVLAG
jgi:hypothetical protein